MPAQTESSVELPVNLRLSKQAGQKLAERASRTGEDVSSIASGLIERAIEVESPDALTPATMEDRVAAWDKFVAGMREWGLANIPPGHVLEDSRESIYEGRGE